MKYYLACSGMMFEEFQHLRDRFPKNFYELRSYWEITEFSGHTLPVFGKDFFMDSGAFSARTQGFDINIKKFGNFIKRYADQVHIFANLDAIPKSKKAEDIEIAAKQTLENQKALEDIAGRAPLPVYHKGEPLSYLEYYLENYDYICIGGLMNKICSNKQFFDIVWRKNTEGGRKPNKLHAFGLAGMSHLLVHPWYSADSSSWLVQSKTGMICVPKPAAKGYNYLVRPEMIAVSEKSSARQAVGWHFETMPQYQQEYIMTFLESIDVKFENLTKDACWRFVVNLHWWKSFGEATETHTATESSRQISLL